MIAIAATATDVDVGDVITYSLATADPYLDIYTSSDSNLSIIAIIDRDFPSYVTEIILGKYVYIYTLYNLV